MKQKLLLAFSLFVFFTIEIKSQNVGIGTLNPHPDAILDLKSNRQGILIPRLSKNQRLSAIPTPLPDGLMVYDNTIGCVFVYDSTFALWKNLCDSTMANSTTLGATTYWDGTQWVLNNANLFNNGGNIGIGTTTPATKLEVNGNIRQAVYSDTVNVAGNTAQTIVWTHNLGYDPVIMFTFDQTGGQNVGFCTASYQPLVRGVSSTITIQNLGLLGANGRVKWIVVY